MIQKQENKLNQKKEIRCTTSADNGIYIGEFPIANGGKEYRVIECMAINNVDFGDIIFQDHSRVIYFGAAKPFPSYEEAQKEANRLYDEVMNGFGICEYGISSIVFDRPLLSKSVKEAQEWLDTAWKNREETLKPFTEKFDKAQSKVYNDPRVKAASQKARQANKEYDKLLNQVKKEFGWQKALDELEAAKKEL